MKTLDFCEKFQACGQMTEWAKKAGYLDKDISETYAALLRGEAGKESLSLAIWCFSRPQVADEKTLRLFAVRCARSVEYLLSDDRSKNAISVAEAYALGNASEEELQAARDAASKVPLLDAAWAVVYVAAWAADASACNAAYAASWWSSYAAGDRMQEEREKQLGFLRDIDVFEVKK